MTAPAPMKLSHGRSAAGGQNLALRARGAEPLKFYARGRERVFCNMVRRACMVLATSGLLGVIASAEPVVRWDFGTEETTKLIEHGAVHRDLPGPRPPEFPDFDPENMAVQFDGQGAHFSFADRGPA